ncbi:uncharacterized protein EV422DRAFT_512177 [Fimicolochytrium jonesii]|uniref:uncharacterized protein n=1 Tax=Fimicolochytrium jonesii TaxID=1396493 RepID=UPI0022FF0538|nr:uncharacterized protein EV422DRAFT_512177 [Fimicolochytrium jonesii]KAI8826981.1 hypothetical protein EV422DRAFT_512177 [Fimicolochytrium jonesii]
MSTKINILVTTAESRTADAILAEFNRKYHNLTDMHMCAQISPNVETKEREYDNVKLITCDPAEASCEELCQAMQNMDTVILIPPASENKVEVAKKLMDCAMKCNVKNCVVLSDCCAELAPDAKQYRKFVEIEKYIKEKCGKGNCHVAFARSGHYMQNLFLYAKQMKENGFLGLPMGKGKFAPVDNRDVAIAVLALATSGSEMSDKFRDKTFHLTGTEVVSGEDIVNAAKEAGLDHKLTFKDIPEEEAKEYLSQIPQMDPSEVELILEDFRLVREGKLQKATSDLKDLIVEKPTTLFDFFKEYKGDFMNPQ